MGRETCKPLIWNSRRIKILAADPPEWGRRRYEAIARQAYRLFVTRGASPGNETDDWRKAEAEVVRALECGLIVQSDRVSACADTGAFGEGNIEVYVEPRRLSLCGPSRTHEYAPANPERELVWRVLDLPVEVDPCHVHAKCNGRILEIDLYRTLLLARVA